MLLRPTLRRVRVGVIVAAAASLALATASAPSPNTAAGLAAAAADSAHRLAVASAPPAFALPAPVVAPLPPADGVRTVDVPSITGLDAIAINNSAVSAASLAGNGIPMVALQAYRGAQAALARSAPGCHLSWSVLAGIGRVESNHGRFGGATLRANGVSQPLIRGVALNGHGVARITDTDGGRWDGDHTFDRAVGPMQFIPGTWARIAADGDGDGVANPNDIYDAALGAGVYLCAANRNLATAQGLHDAIFSYNHSESYVALVTALTRAYRAGVPIDSLPAATVRGATPKPPKSQLPPATSGNPPAARVPTTPTAGGTTTTSTTPLPAAPGQALPVRVYGSTANNQATVMWRKPTSGGAPTSYGVAIYHLTAGSHDAGAVATGTAAATATSWTSSGVAFTAGDKYVAEVTARNAAGAVAPASSSLAGTVLVALPSPTPPPPSPTPDPTPPPPSPTPDPGTPSPSPTSSPPSASAPAAADPTPAAVSALALDLTPTSQLHASWAAAAGATGYTVQLFKVVPGADQAVGPAETIAATAAREVTWAAVVPAATDSYYVVVTPTEGSVSGPTTTSPAIQG
jgi:membrane-bound lytic murein transglycosylase B